ncbi:MAG: molybdopterin-dependent oxidoreductase [Oscillospiraceae bacterium]
MKKLLIVLSIVLSLSMVFAGCSKAPANEPAKDSAPQQEAVATPEPQGEQPVAPEVETPNIKLAVEGVDKVTEITGADLVKLTVTDLTSAVTNKNGETSENVYTGVILKDVLASMGVTDLKTLTIEASDGYKVVYEKDMALADDVILAWLKDGHPMENNEVRITPAKASGKTLAKMAVKLIVEQ